MDEGIWLVTDSGLTAMKKAHYETEEAFQKLLARHPQLLAGRPGDGSSWLLVSREMAIPDAQDGAGRWSLDHLFLDREGIPTLVEVKRASDTRARREVVAQMLDYAANGVAWWPPEEIRSRFEARCREESGDPSEILAEFLGGAEPEAYWQAVKVNLQAGRIRMVFVADEIAPELRRIVEFLNYQMDPAEVVAVELRQYVGEGGVCTLVPKVYGRTAGAEARKGSVEGRRWDEETLLAAMEEHLKDVAAGVARWGAERGELRWGKGRTGGFSIHLPAGGRTMPALSLYLYERGPKLHVHLADMQKAGLPEDALTGLVDRLNAIPGVSIPPLGEKSYPSILLAALAKEDAAGKFFAAMNGLLAGCAT